MRIKERDCKDGSVKMTEKTRGKSSTGRKYQTSVKLGSRKKRHPYYDAYPFGGAGGGRRD
jgi:hypothetical protein